jgi:ABC-2 type transport system ATP-binding protein
MPNIGQSSVMLRAENVHVQYGDQQILRGLNLSILAGEIYALLGGNGAGKSTTLSTFLGFLRPTNGRVEVAGTDPATDTERARRHIAYLPENVAFYEHLTARENVDYLLALSSDARSMEAVEKAFADTGLQADAWDRPVAGFSKGMRQKVAIAIALLRDVPVLLLDEPTSGLDPKATSDFNRLMLRLREQGTAILMVTHDLLSAADSADRIGFLDAGCIVQETLAQGPQRFDIQALHRQFSGALRT